MLGRFPRFGLDIKLSFKTDLFAVFDRHVHKDGQMLYLTFEVCVEQRGITFAAAPENVAFAVQAMRDLERLLHLRSGEREHIGIRTGRSAVSIARMYEKLGSAPEKFDPGTLLFFFQHFDNCIQVPIALAQILSLGRDIAIVKGIKWSAQ